MNGAAAGRQLDRPVHAGRARPAAVHQRLGDDLLRRPHSRPEDDGRRRRRPAGASGDGRRVPHRRRRDLRRDRRAGRRRTRSRSSRRRWTAPAIAAGTLAVARRPARPGAGARSAAGADDGRHGPRRHDARTTDGARRPRMRPHAGHAHAGTPGATAVAHPASETRQPARRHADDGAARRSWTIPGIGLRDNGRRVLTYADLHERVRRSRRPRAGAHDRAAPDRPHGALRLVVRRRASSRTPSRCA